MFQRVFPPIVTCKIPCNGSKAVQEEDVAAARGFMSTVAASVFQLSRVM